MCWNLLDIRSEIWRQYFGTMLSMEMCPHTFFLGVITKISGFRMLWQISSTRKSQTFIQGLVSHQLTVYLSELYSNIWINEMEILSKVCKPDNFDSINSLKLSFTNTQVLCFNFVGCESLLKIKLFRNSCFMWQKLGRLNWL